MFDVNAEKKLDNARGILRDKLKFYYGDASLDCGLKRVADLAVYECAQKYVATYEKNYFDEIFAKEMAKQPIQVMPLPKPKTVVDFEIDATHWDFPQIAEYIKKLCEEHEGKRDLHIKFAGKANPLDS